MEWVIKPLFDAKGYQQGYEVIQMLTRCKDCACWNSENPCDGEKLPGYCQLVDHQTEPTYFCKYGSPIDPGVEDKT